MHSGPQQIPARHRRFKNLPLEKREALYARITKVAAFGVGMASVEEIDSINIYWARMLAMTRAVEALGVEPAWVLVDGNACPKWQRPSKAIVDGDAKCRSIAAASIIAKVTRDRMMAEHAVAYPGYGWERTAAIRRRSPPRLRSLGRRRCTAEASAWCARSWRPRPSRSWPFLKSSDAQVFESHHHG